MTRVILHRIGVRRWFFVKVGFLVFAVLVAVRIYLPAQEGGGDPVAQREATAQVNLFVDTNNDGSIDTSLADGHEHAYANYAPGVVVCKDRAGDGFYLDHLVEMKLNVSSNLTTGTVTLQATSGSNLVKVWTSASKTTEIVLPKTYTLGTDTVPTSVWIDGMAVGQAAFGLSYSDTQQHLVCSDQVAVFVTETISWSPSGTFAYAWEPCNWPAGTPGKITTAGVDAAINNIKDHGWNVTTCRYSDTTGPEDPNDSVEDCTLSHFKDLKYGGILVIDTHGADTGDAGALMAVYRITPENVDSWREGDSTILIAGSMYWGNVAVITPTWLNNSWKSIRDQNNGVTLFFTCFGAKGGQMGSSVGNAGGRVMFGYTDDRTISEHEADSNRLLGRMNGALSGGTKRTAGQAYEGGSGYTATFTMYGDEWTTLNPAPNYVFPDHVAANRKGAGCIICDTYMKDSVLADDAVCVIEGPVFDERWFGNGSGSYGVSFDFDKTGGGTRTMRAVADNCLNSATTSRKMAGDRATYASDKDWSF